MILFVGQVGDLRQRASQASGFAAAVIAAVVLIGWWAALPLLSSWGPGLPAMRPSGALALAALCFALVHPGKDSRVAFAVGLVLAALAAVGLGLAPFNVELRYGIDRLLAPSAAVPRLGATLLRVAAAGTLAFALASGSLALSRFVRHRLAAIMLGGFAGAIAVLALLGYLKGIDTVYGSVSVDSPPLPAALGLLCAASGIVLRIGTMLRDSERQLCASKARLETAVNIAQLGSWQYDPHQRVASLDMRAKEIFDVAESEAPIEEVMKLVHPDDAERVWAAFVATLDPAEPKRSATEFRLRRRDGEVRWVETLGVAYFEGTGRERRAASIVGTVQDITERKEREEKEHLLMREVSHRAKNARCRARDRSTDRH